MRKIQRVIEIKIKHHTKQVSLEANVSAIGIWLIGDCAHTKQKPTNALCNRIQKKLQYKRRKTQLLRSSKREEKRNSAEENKANTKYCKLFFEFSPITQSYWHKCASYRRLIRNQNWNLASKSGRNSLQLRTSQTQHFLLLLISWISRQKIHMNSHAAECEEILTANNLSNQNRCEVKWKN